MSMVRSRRVADSWLWCSESPPGFEHGVRARYDELAIHMHAEWWATHHDHLDWQTIDTYRMLPGSADMRATVALRAGDRWPMDR